MKVTTEQRDNAKARLRELAGANDRKKREEKKNTMPAYWTEKETDESVANWVIRLAICYSLSKRGIKPASVARARRIARLRAELSELTGGNDG